MQSHAREFARKCRGGEGSPAREPPAREGVGGGVPTPILMPVIRMPSRSYRSQDEPHRARIAQRRTGLAKLGGRCREAFKTALFGKLCKC